MSVASILSRCGIGGTQISSTTAEASQTALLKEILSEVQQLRTEVTNMADTQASQDAQLATDITALSGNLTTYFAAVQAKLTALQALPAAADPAVAAGLAEIEAITNSIASATTALNPPTATTGAAS